MGQMREFAYQLAKYMYEEKLEDDQIVETLLKPVTFEERNQAEEWLRKQIQYLRENPYPIRNILV